MKNIFLIISILFSLKSYSQDIFTNGWEYVGHSNGTVWHIKSNYVKKEGNVVKVWTGYKGSYQGDDTTYSNAICKALYKFNVSEKQYEILSFFVYNTDGVKLITSYEMPEDKISWHDVVPGSMIEAVLNKASQLFYQKKQQ